MSDMTEGLGSMVEGAGLARAVEPEARGDAHDEHAKRSQGHFQETECLNCGTGLVGSHCHNCGQEAHLHRTLGAFLHDLLHGVLHLDGKTWRTIPLLVWKPGELTREYIDGRRRRYVSPMAMFLFSIFVMFGVFSVMGIAPPVESESNGTVRENVATGVRSLEDRRDALAADLAAANASDVAERERLAKELAKTKSDLEAIRNVPLIGPDSSPDRWQSGWKRLDKGIAKWRKNQSLMLYKLQSTGYKFSWLLVPLSLPFMWLLFAWKRRYALYDHSVFVTYSIAFMSLLFIAITILSGLGVGSSLLTAAAIVVPIVHVYRQLRGAYALSRFSAIWRTAVLMVFFIPLVAAAFFAILLLIGMVG